MKKAKCLLLGAIAVLMWSGTSLVQSAQYTVRIDGTDAIFLAGRTDVEPIPAPTGDPNLFILLRHGYITPENATETLPPYISVAGGDVVKVSDPAVGGINFYNGFGPPYYGPEGNSPTSDISALGGISGYKGTQGALAGVFLNDSIPSSGPAPVTLDFLSAASRDFASLSPALGQVFFIGDGKNSLDQFQEFEAPAGATRLFLGIPDGFGFVGVPGAYDDNDGYYLITIGVNELPPPVPEAGASVLLLGLSLAGLGVGRRLFQS